MCHQSLSSFTVERSLWVLFTPIRCIFFFFVITKKKKKKKKQAPNVTKNTSMFNDSKNGYTMSNNLCESELLFSDYLKKNPFSPTKDKNHYFVKSILPQSNIKKRKNPFVPTTIIKTPNEQSMTCFSSCLDHIRQENNTNRNSGNCRNRNV